jgi:transposase
MTLLPRGVKVHLAFGFIDMRKGIDGLTMLVQGVLRQDPFSGHLFVFRVRKAIVDESHRQQLRCLTAVGNTSHERNVNAGIWIVQ